MFEEWLITFLYMHDVSSPNLHLFVFCVERRHADGDSHWHLLWLLAGRLLLYLFPGIPVQCPDHYGANVVIAGTYRMGFLGYIMTCLELQ